MGRYKRSRTWIVLAHNVVFTQGVVMSTAGIFSEMINKNAKFVDIITARAYI